MYISCVTRYGRQKWNLVIFIRNETRQWIVRTKFLDYMHFWPTQYFYQQTWYILIYTEEFHLTWIPLYSDYNEQWSAITNQIKSKAVINLCKPNPMHYFTGKKHVIICPSFNPATLSWKLFSVPCWSIFAFIPGHLNQAFVFSTFAPLHVLVSYSILSSCTVYPPPTPLKIPYCKDSRHYWHLCDHVIRYVVGEQNEPERKQHIPTVNWSLG